MARLMQQLAEYQGYCCVRDMLQKNQGKRSEYLADRLGVSRRAISDWRKKLREGRCECKELPTCALREPRRIPAGTSSADDQSVPRSSQHPDDSTRNP